MFNYSMNHTRQIKKNALFFICPSDCLEYLIRNEFSGDAFFYTSLGVNFKFDLETQQHLWKLIAKYNIENIAFITSANNQFHRHGSKHIEKQIGHLKNTTYLGKKLEANKLQIEGFIYEPRLNAFYKFNDMIREEHITHEFSNN